MSNTLKQRYDRAAGTILASLLVTLVILASQLPSSPWLEPVSKRIHPLSNRLDLMLYDLRFNVSLRLKEPVKAAHRILIVDIDEKSLAEIGRWPWSRKTIADLTNTLFDAGASVVAFDVMFSEPERNVVTELRTRLPQRDQDVQQFLTRVERDFDNDKAFANVLKERDVVLGFLLHEEPVLSNKRPRSNLYTDSIDSNSISIEAMDGLTANIPVLQEAVLAEGFINGPPDADGIVRRAPLVYRYQDRFYSSLALQTARVYSLIDNVGIHTTPIGDHRAVTDISLGDMHIPTDNQGKMLIPYRGGRGYFTYFSAADILDHRIDKELLSGAIVLIGTSAIGLGDLRGTPVGIQYPGVESQASVIDGILTGDIPSKPDWAMAANLVAIVLLFFLLNAVLPLCGPLMMILFGTLIAFSMIGLNFWFWHKQLIDLPLAGTLTVVLITFMCYLAYGFLFSSRQKNQIQGMFGQYVAPAHIDKLMSNPEALTFDGETKEMTVLFCDVRNFTSISEKLSANQLKDFLNRYFTPMTEIIFSQQGTIDKYVGDMIMAFWGAPLDDDNQKKHAVTTALQMIAKTHELRPVLIEMGYPEVHIGIGINSGMMNVGDMGSIYRRAYTVLGDSVNLGARLEGITKFYGASILISEFTLAGVENIFLCREVDAVIVKGKNEAIRIYEPIALMAKASPEQLALVKAFHDARSLFLQRQWEPAKTAFKTLLATDPASSTLYTVYIDRCTQYANAPPAEDWQGVWKHESK